MRISSVGIAVRGHRRHVVIVEDGVRRPAAVSWDDDDRLGLFVYGRRIEVEEDESDAALFALLRSIDNEGVQVECCARCHHFVYSGMGADTNSGMGVCSEGKDSERHERSDETAMWDWCEAFVHRDRG